MIGTLDQQNDILLVHDHSKLDEILEQLFDALGRGDRRQTFLKLDHFWAGLAVHIRAEHLVLFRALLQSSGNSKSKGGVADVVSRLPDNIYTLRHDHDFFVKEIGKDVNLLRVDEKEKRKNVDLGEIHKDLVIIAGRLEVHNALEEADVYPLAQALFTAKEVADLEVSMSRELAKLPPRFGNIRLPLKENIDG